MKWRTSAVYLLILLLLGGYFYYFEVVKKEEKEAAEKAAKRAFTFAADTVKAIEIRSGDAQPLRLEKDKAWRISQPVNTDVDRMTFNTFFSALQKIEQERKLGPSTDKLEAFGLTKPTLTVRLQTGDNEWLDLLVGGENPAGNSRYAQVGSAGEVFLMTRMNYEAVNKGLKELRRKELFTFQTDQVVGMEATWQSGEKVSLERPNGTHEWKAKEKPDLKLRARKVEEVIDQVHWLRAVDFPEKSTVPEKTMVHLSLRLKDGQVADLKVGNPDSTNRQADALCSGLDSPVSIPSHIIAVIPKSADVFADRSLLAWDGADVREVKWKTSASEGNVAYIDENNWGVKQGDAAPKALKDSWPVKLFLTDLDSIEYQEVVEPQPPLPEGNLESVQFKDVEGRTGSFKWKDIPKEENEPAVLWLEKDGQTRAVKLLKDAVERIDKAIGEMADAVKGKTE